MRAEVYILDRDAGVVSLVDDLNGEIGDADAFILRLVRGPNGRRSLEVIKVADGERTLVAKKGNV